ncbi:hypothetical protein [Citrobacter freundii]
MSTQHALACFFVPASVRAKIMVGWMGEPRGSPGSSKAGKTNSIQLTTSKIGLFGGVV